MAGRCLFLVLCAASSRLIEGFTCNNALVSPISLGTSTPAAYISGNPDDVIFWASSAASRTTELYASSKSSPSKKSKKKSKGKDNASPSVASKNNSRRTSSPSMTLAEVAEHVSHEYLHGPGGKLRDAQRRRKNFEATYYHSTASDRLAHTVQDQTTVDLSCTPDGAEHDESDDSTFGSEAQVLRNLDRHPALVLNADYQPLSYLPLSLWHWQEAVKAVFNGKVTVVDVYPDVSIRAANLQVPLPSVIALTDYVSPKYMSHAPAFTKRNVFLRDEYRCQYCGDMFHTRDLSLDHVVPRCRGGQLHWENAVTSCTGCNGKKGSMGLREIRSKFGMKLRCEPRIPTQYELAMTASKMLPRKVHPTWEPYLPTYQQQQKTNRQASARQKEHRRNQNDSEQEASA